MDIGTKPNMFGNSALRAAVDKPRNATDNGTASANISLRRIVFPSCIIDRTKTPGTSSEVGIQIAARITELAGTNAFEITGCPKAGTMRERAAILRPTMGSRIGKAILCSFVGPEKATSTIKTAVIEIITAVAVEVNVAP
jgi:hypothetical protein